MRHIRKRYPLFALLIAALALLVAACSNPSAPLSANEDPELKLAHHTMCPRNGVYYILHNHAGHNSFLALDVRAASLKDHAPIQQFPLHRGPNQQWRVTKLANGFCTIVNVHSGKALDIPTDRPVAINLQQFRFHGGPRQQWRMTYHPPVNGPTLFRPAYYRIYNRRTGMALDVPNGSQSSGVVVQQFQPHNGWNQTWLFYPVR